MSKSPKSPKNRAPILIQPPHSDEIITIHAVAQPTRKRRGEAAEAAFLARATHLGFSVLIPWGDSDRYDSVVDFGHGLLRCQVKSATLLRDNRYRVKTCGASGQVYTIKDIDFFVGVVYPEPSRGIPDNIWYIIPIEAIGQRKGVRFYPHTRRPSRAIFEKYRNAWCLLDCEKKSRGWKDIPTVCRSREVQEKCAVCPNVGRTLLSDKSRQH